MASGCVTKQQRRIGKHYPQATLDDGTKATVIAWIWARTVTCPNPACGIEMPLARSWWLGKKKDKEAWIRPIVAADAGYPGGKRVWFEIGHGLAGAPSADDDGTVSRRGGVPCVACGSAVALNHIREEGRAAASWLSAQLMAIVAEGHRKRVYLGANTRAHRERRRSHGDG